MAWLGLRSIKWSVGWCSAMRVPSASSVLRISQCSRRRCPAWANQWGCACSAVVNSPAPGAKTEPGGKEQGKSSSSSVAFDCQSSPLPNKISFLSMQFSCRVSWGVTWEAWMLSPPGRQTRMGPGGCCRPGGRDWMARSGADASTSWQRRPVPLGGHCLPCGCTTDPVPLCVTWDLRIQ